MAPHMARISRVNDPAGCQNPTEPDRDSCLRAELRCANLVENLVENFVENLLGRGRIGPIASSGAGEGRCGPGRRSGVRLVEPFQGSGLTAHRFPGRPSTPLRLPWAMLCGPVGANGETANGDQDSGLRQLSELREDQEAANGRRKSRQSSRPSWVAEKRPLPPRRKPQCKTCLDPSIRDRSL